VLLVGMKGHGKTCLARRIAEQTSRVVVLDPKEDFGGGVVLSEGAHIWTWLYEARNWPKFSAILRPTTEEDEAAFWAATRPAKKGGFLEDCLIVLDEIDTWAKPEKTYPDLHSLIHYGRHQNISLLGTCRRTANTSRDYTSQCDDIAAFRNEEPDDIVKLSKYMDTTGIQDLQPGEFIQREDAEMLRGI
jgi:hypothetical protein